MRQKNTVYSPSHHNQFQESSEELKIKQEKEKKVDLKDVKQGQSDFGKKKRIEK
jgi:hypothetical protein